MTAPHATPVYAVRTSAGFLHVTSDFSSAVAVAETQLDRYGYPKYAEWLADLDATAGVLGDCPWFYGHVSVEYYGQEDYAVKLGIDAGLRPYVFEGSYLRGSTWTELDAPEGGSTASWSNFREPYGDETPTYFEVPVTAWGDYIGSAVERSNHRSLERDYPESFVDATAFPGSHTLMMPLSAVTEELVNLLTGLRDEYPLYDESDHSELEMELADEAWGAYARYDLVRDLRDAGVPDETLDAISEAELRERFYTAVSESNEYPYAETADSIVFPMWDAVVSTLADHYGVAS